jgi:very-short-patch-repair endonuclease
MVYNAICYIPTLNCLKVINMPVKFSTADVNYIINKYATGVGTLAISKALGVGYQPVTRILSENGVHLRNKREAVIAGVLSKVSIAEIISLFSNGIGVNGISERFGVSRAAVGNILKDQGIALRNRSQQQFARMKNATPEQIKALTKSAHDAVRGTKKSRSSQEEFAQTKEARGSGISSPAEYALASMLKDRGIETVRQKAIGIYNCDLASGTVAVEVFGGNWHWHGNHLARTEKRFNEIMNSGWNILAIAVNASSPLTDAVADYVAAYIQEVGRNPPVTCEYRVIWRAGEFSTGGRLNDENFSIEPPFTCTRDIVSGRYVTITR